VSVSLLSQRTPFAPQSFPNPPLGCSPPECAECAPQAASCYCNSSCMATPTCISGYSNEGRPLVSCHAHTVVSGASGVDCAGGTNSITCRKPDCVQGSTTCTLCASGRWGGQCANGAQCCHRNADSICAAQNVPEAQRRPATTTAPALLASAVMALARATRVRSTIELQSAN
jgi:hypothetical protein